LMEELEEPPFMSQVKDFVYSCCRSNVFDG